MSDTSDEAEPAYHLLLDPDEVPVTASALRLLISDAAHQPRIRGLARDVLAALDGDPDAQGVLAIPLGAGQLKITYSAVKLLLDDLQRDQADERATLRSILAKLPDEHSIRAISIE
jgi:hypothetical protein